MSQILPNAFIVSVLVFPDDHVTFSDVVNFVP